ncbi:hypothetical protein NWFMUON74_59800 [Nocardia wallacei]|uniref:Uncharacterized protein n=1 Tax=Nocardia wallacei TaxID=480035 RepID=A0A7G1KSH5_9NOCA|nr:hypothetical protein NWFMUON74_59800 [Nocardia wallacei]
MLVRGNHVRIGDRRNDSKSQSCADVVPDHLERTCTPVPGAVETDPPTGVVQFIWCGRPFVEVIDHPTDRAEAGSQHRQQTRQLCDEITAVRPPDSVDIRCAGGVEFEP